MRKSGVRYHNSYRTSWFFDIWDFAGFCEFFLKWNILNVSVILSVEPGKSLVAIDVQQTALLIFLHTPA